MAKDDDAWFAPKAFGFGAGMPIAWQGWVTLGVYLLVVTGAALGLAPRSRLAFFAVVAAATVVLTALAARHTRGGFRWRWGGRD